MYAHDKYLNVLVLICGLLAKEWYQTCFKEVTTKVCATKFDTPHAHEHFVPSVDIAECQLSMLNGFFV